MSDGAKRVARLQRILKVQAQKRLLEEWRLAHLRQERAALDAADAEMLASMGTDSRASRPVRRGEGRRACAATTSCGAPICSSRTSPSTALKEARKAEKGIEKIRDEALREEEVEIEARDLEARVEGFLAGRRSSFE